MILLCLLACIFSLASLPTAALADDGCKTVRVGYYTSEGFQEGDGDGTRRGGYSYEYLQKVASYTGWRYEYVDGSWQELYGKLLSGEIDLMAGIAYTDERAGEMYYSNFEMLSETFYIYKDSGDASVKSGDYAAYSGKTIGVVDDGKMPPYLESWMTSNGVQADVAVFSDLAACADAFNDREIDCFVSADNIVSGYSGISPVEMVGRLPYYVCVAKDRADLLEELDSALSLIHGQDSLFLTELRNKYTADTSISIFLSRQEKEWLEENAGITVGYMDEYMPYCGTDSDGNACGLLVDAMGDLFAALPGNYSPAISYVAYKDQSDMIAALQSGDVDAVFPVSGDFSHAEDGNYQQSSTVVQSAVDLLYVGDYGTDKLVTIAVNKNNNLQYEYTGTYFPDAEILFCDSMPDCIAAVKSGKAGCTFAEALRAVEYTGSDSSLKIIPMTENNRLCFGVAYGNNSLLRVLNHGLSMLGEEYALNHAYMYMGDIVSGSIKESVKTYAAVSAVLVLICICAAAVIKFNSMRKIAKKDAEHNEALQKALFEVQKSNYAKRAFLHSVSHDIRTPINVIHGLLEMNNRTDDPEQLRRNREKASTALKHLAGMTERMIEASRLESGDKISLHERVDMPALVNQIEARIREQTCGKDITLTTAHEGLSDNVPAVYGNSMSIQEVLMHVLENAVKYNRAGGSVSWCDTFSPLSDGRWEYTATVTDTGVGIGKEHLAHIYEPFFQAKNDARTTYIGSGLGLAIVKNLLDQMGGQIDIESVEGTGTTVTVRIPMAVCACAADTDSGCAADAQCDIAGMKILLVEDNELNREIEASLLEGAGAVVTTAENGREGLETYLAAEDGGFDVILMDLMMPEMDGYEAAGKIRASGRADAADLPIIAVTACIVEDAEKSEQAGLFSGFAAKPLDMAQLTQCICALCTDRQSPAP